MAGKFSSELNLVADWVIALANYIHQCNLVDVGGVRTVSMYLKKMRSQRIDQDRKWLFLTSPS